VFFFEKKNQKTFALLFRPLWQRRRPDPALKSKSFLLLFFKKEALPYLLAYLEKATC
jgi:hypothetical protein